MGAMTDYLENKIMDWLFRQQPFVPPATLYFGLFTVTPTDAGGGTEVVIGQGAYARVPVASSLVNWAGTQGATTTAVSSGASGTTSNNVPITFPTPNGAAWGVVNSFGIFDASTGGNLLFYGTLLKPKTVNDGDAAPTWPISVLTCQIDN